MGLDIFFSQVQLRHKCRTNLLVEVNSHLTAAQKARIQSTPFRWTIQMGETLELSCPLLLELLYRWDEHLKGFRVGSRLVKFTLLHVCFALGLRIVGERVLMHDPEESHTRSLFEGKDITIPTIVEQLKLFQRDEQVDDFCRLYLFLAFSVFYFPKTTSPVNGALLSMLDNLDALDQYNWGAAIYDSLSASLTRSARSVSEGMNSDQVTITGCAAVLQVYQSCVYVVLCNTPTT